MERAMVTWEADREGESREADREGVSRDLDTVGPVDDGG